MPGPDQPIACPIDPGRFRSLVSAQPDGPPHFLTFSRALEGMQKEALVLNSATGRCWRLLCDEGPWLNGTDLAPFPLGYFAAGLASSFMADIQAEAAVQSASVTGLTVRLEILFSMEGSILRGTMAAGVDSINLIVGTDPAVEPGIDQDSLESIAIRALADGSAVCRALSEHLPSRFWLQVNGAAVQWPGEVATALTDVPDPLSQFDQRAAVTNESIGQPVVHKDTGHSPGETGGAVGLQSDQKRSVHISADAHQRNDGLQVIGAQCVQPVGSRFLFLGDPEGERAPSGATYLSAGIAFCFMTQLGRYAQIRKLLLNGYRLVQKTSFDARATAPAPVETAVFLDSDDSAEANLQMVRMGEQTCYVHTALRERNAPGLQNQ